MKTETLFSSKNDEWRTPTAFFEKLDDEFFFTLDPCSPGIWVRNKTIGIGDQDGLELDWGGHTVWCNPPYSQIKKWVRKCYYEGHKPNTTVVMLVPSRTDTKWWHNYVQHKAEVRFIKGRLRFSGAKENAPFPSAIVIYRGPEE